MKKSLFILFLAVVGGIALLLMPSRPQTAWQPKTRLTFLGFTNVVAGAPATNAWFGISEIPVEDTGWRVVEISRRAGGRWQRWDPQPVTSFAWQHPKPSGFNLGATVPVESTNAATRVVIELRRGPGSDLERFFAKLEMWWANLIHHYPARGSQSRGPVFFLTNEFNIVSGTNVARP